jgi:DNA modification methylase
MTESIELIRSSSLRMPEIADQDASLVFTGPPYFSESLEAKFLDGLDSDASLKDLAGDVCAFAWRLRPVFQECFRILRPGGRMIIQTRDVRLRQMLAPVESLHRQMAEAAGFHCYTRHLWRPAHVTLGRRRIAASLSRAFGPMPFDPEVFLVMVKPGVASHDKPSRDPPDLDQEDVDLLCQDIMVTGRGYLPSPHRWQTPLNIARVLVKAHSAVGDLVVDPFAGGGTILIAARDLRRRAMGYEIDADAYELATKNIAHGQTSRETVN